MKSNDIDLEKIYIFFNDIRLLNKWVGRNEFLKELRRGGPPPQIDRRRRPARVIVNNFKRTIAFVSERDDWLEDAMRVVFMK